MKCELCKYSHLQNGKMVCPYHRCMLNTIELKEVYEVLKHMGGTFNKERNDR